MSATNQRQSDVVARTQMVAREVAAAHADDVDVNSRFPTETFTALKQAKLLSAAVPAALGGAGSNMRELVDQCTVLAQACASSGMVLAMHHIQVACLARHALQSPFFQNYLREVVERQTLIASITSEVGVW